MWNSHNNYDCPLYSTVWWIQRELNNITGKHMNQLISYVFLLYQTKFKISQIDFVESGFFNFLVASFISFNFCESENKLFKIEITSSCFFIQIPTPCSSKNSAFSSS